MKGHRDLKNDGVKVFHKEQHACMRVHMHTHTHTHTHKFTSKPKLELTKALNGSRELTY